MYQKYYCQRQFNRHVHSVKRICTLPVTLTIPLLGRLSNVTINSKYTLPRSNLKHSLIANVLLTNKTKHLENITNVMKNS